MPRKVLIIRFSSIGDIVLTSPVVRMVKLQYADEVHFVTKKAYASVVSTNPYIDKIITIDQEVTEVISKLREMEYDLVIDCHKSLRSLRLRRALGIRNISFDKLNVQKWLRVHLRLPMLHGAHIIDRYIDMLDQIGVKDDGQGMDFVIPDAVQRPSDVPSSYIAIVLGANYHTKRIPVEMVQHMMASKKLPVVLIGGKDVANIGKQLSSSDSDVYDYTGSLSIVESAAVLQEATFVITGDTGMMHISAALKRPILMVWGSTAYEIGMYPYYGSAHDVPLVQITNPRIRCNPCTKIGRDRCPKGHFRCMMGITAAEIDLAMDTMYQHIGL